MGLKEVRELDHLLIELEISGINSLSLIFRSICGDGDEYVKFMKRLDLRIKNHSKEIQNLCNENYQSFVDCINQLLNLRQRADQLKKGVFEINSDVQKSSENVLKKAEQLIKNRRIQFNTEKAIDHLKFCLPVLEMYSKLNNQMIEKKYYQALKSLEQLESNYLPKVSIYRFAQIILSKIPKLKEEIKDSSMKDLKDFLEGVRKNSSKLGELSMRQVAAQQNIDNSILDLIKTSSNQYSSLENLSQNSSLCSNQFRKSQSNLNLNLKSSFDLEKYLNSFDEEIILTDIIDFQAVYQCLHIYDCLGELDTFEQYYRQQREKQAKLALQTSTTVYESIEDFKKYFCDIIGFFVIEEHVLTTSNGLMTKNHLDLIWVDSLQSIITFIRMHISVCTDSKLMLQIKKIVILFIHTLQSYGYEVDPLFKVLIEIRDQYNEILMKQWVDIFKAIFEADNYNPIIIYDLKDHKDLLIKLPFYDFEVTDINNLDLTSTNFNNEDYYLKDNNKLESYNEEIKSFKYPFSSFVPNVFNEIKRYVNACLEFSQDLNLDRIEIEDMILKSTNLLLTCTLSGCLSALIKKPNLGLLQLIQIAINTNYLENTSIHLEEYIIKKIAYNFDDLSKSISSESLTSPTKLLNQQTNQFKLQGKLIFKEARKDAEEQIYVKLNNKLDEFLGLASYDWLMVESSGLASSYITDLIAFLKSTFQVFTNLPINIGHNICHLTFKHIANSLKNFLLDEDVKCISLGAISQFNLDLLQCEIFASSEPIKDLESADLLICFAELRQLIDLFMDWDWSTYFTDFGKQHSKYLRVKASSALTILEKIKEGEKKKNLFVLLKKNERDKKKLTETVIKNLKRLIDEDKRIIY